MKADEITELFYFVVIHIGVKQIFNKFGVLK